MTNNTNQWQNGPPLRFKTGNSISSCNKNWIWKRFGFDPCIKWPTSSRGPKTISGVRAIFDGCILQCLRDYNSLQVFSKDRDAPVLETLPQIWQTVPWLSRAKIELTAVLIILITTMKWTSFYHSSSINDKAATVIGQHYKVGVVKAMTSLCKEGLSDVTHGINTLLHSSH